MDEIWPFDNAVLLEACNRGRLDLGPLSTALLLYELLEEKSSPFLPDRALAELGDKVAFYSEIHSLFVRNKNYVRYHLPKVTENLTQMASVIKRVLCIGYESRLWDTVFEYVPKTEFFVLSLDISKTASVRLANFQNVQEITLGDVGDCAGRGSALVLTGYGFVHGDDEVIYANLGAELVLKTEMDSAFEHRVAVGALSCEVGSDPPGMTRIEIPATFSLVPRKG